MLNIARGVRIYQEAEMKIYLASSWKNVVRVKDWAKALRREGHEVDAFCDAGSGRFVFAASENADLLDLDAVTFLTYERSRKAFCEDKKWLDWANVCILILPAGNSAHLEAGYAKGQGKKLIIYRDKFPPGEFDVMYGFADLITDDPQKVIMSLE